MVQLTYKYRIKDATSRKVLNVLSEKVNFVWNYINDLSYKYFKRYRGSTKFPFMTAWDINYYTAGSSKELGLRSSTIQSISDIYVTNKKECKKFKLSWRSNNKSLGWIPFKVDAIKIFDDYVSYFGHKFKIYKDRNIPISAKVTNGSFNQDARGRWYVSISFKIPKTSFVHLENEVGIDLGVKESATLSNGETIENPHFKELKEKLVCAQRAGKKKQTTNLNARIVNSRKDFYHKETTKITKRFSKIVIGDVKSNDIIKISYKNLRKGVYDAYWGTMRALLEYKAKKLGGEFKLVPEAYTTQDCSCCLTRCGPKGKEGLSVREWICTACGAKHNRDVNSALNILRLGRQAP
jgi:putative transposase